MTSHARATWIRLVAVTLLFSVAARAQSPRQFKRIEIVFTGTECLHAPRDVTVVIHHAKKQIDQQNVTRPSGADQSIEWKGFWVPEAAYASVRSEAMRTDCVKGDARYRDGVLRFTFHGCYPAQTVTITADPPEMTSSYLRDLAISKQPCGEAYSFQGMRVFSAVQFNIEHLLLQLGSEPPADNGTGLNVGALVRRARKEKSAFKQQLTRNKVVHVLSVQRVNGNQASANISPNAIDLDIGKLEFAGLNSITIQVQ